VYDANGNKLRKTVSNGTSQDYLGGIEYSGGGIDAIYHEEGRATFNGAWQYEYYLKDHLGNTRVIFADSNNDGTPEIIQEADYYPFGMRHDRSITATNHYLYNGKELNTDLGLDWYDYGARWYDAEIARWSAIDPHASSYVSNSPYDYVMNNPIIMADPTGKDAIVTITRNSNGLGGTINIAATVYVTGLNAEQKTKDLEAAKEIYFRSDDYRASNDPLDIYNITFNVEYIYLEDVEDYTPGEGRNLMTFVPDPKEQSHVSNGLQPVSVVVRGPGYYNELGEEWKMDKSTPEGMRLPPGFKYHRNSRHERIGWTAGSRIIMGNTPHYSSTWGGIHETFHVLGLSDRYYPGHKAHPHFEGDIMGRRGQSGIHQVHYDNWGRYILGKGEDNFILKNTVDRTIPKELIGP